jgi:FkbM family methyltransferase
MNSSEKILKKLDRVEQLVRGSIFTRIISHPVRYAGGVGYRELIYPFRRKPVFAEGNTIFDRRMVCPLPGAMDIFLFGAKTHDSEIRLARFLIHHAEWCVRFLDVGAHIGYFTLLVERIAALKGLPARIVSIEPATENFRVLEQNVRSTPTVQVLKAAMGDQNTRLAFYEFPDRYSEYNSFNIDQYKEEQWMKNWPPRKTEVDSITLDTFCIQHEFFPTLIKIDVEGAEDKVLKGGAGVLSKHRPVIVMEFLSDRNRNGAHHAAHDFLISMNYRAHGIDAAGQLFALDTPATYLTGRSLDSDNIVYLQTN